MDGVEEAVRGTPGGILLEARAEAGWGHWPRVRELLEGRPWLSEVDGAVGLALRARAAEAEEAWEEAASGYGRYLEVAPEGDSRALGVARIRRALSLARAGEVTAALDELRRLEEALGSSVASWSAARMARILSEEGHPEGTRLAAEAISEGEAQVRVGALVARAHLSAGDSAAALGAFREAAASAGGGERAELDAGVGELALARGDTAAATEALLRALEAGDGSGSASADAAELLLELDALPDGETARTAADALFRTGREERGLEALNLSMALLDQEAADLSTDLRLMRARLVAVHGSADEAREELLRLAESGGPSVAAPALWHLARLHRRRGRRAEARAAEDRLVREAPERPEAVDVVFFRGDDLHDRGDMEGAAGYYRRAVEMAPTLNRSGLARMRLAQIRLGQGEVAGAAEVFEGYLADFPRGRRWQEAAYWAARTRLELGDSARAREHLSRIREDAELSYYRVLAGQLTGEPFELPAGEELEESPAPGWLETGLEEVDLFRHAELERGMRAAVDRLADRARSEDASRSALLSLAEGLNRRGLTMEGISLGWEVRGAGRAWDLRLLRIVYPMPYREMLFREAEEWDVDPFLAAAIIRQESAFWHRAVSRAGAVGLMQVMPATGTSLARSVGPDGFVPDVLTTPEVNLHLGTRFLRDMTERFGPDLPLVLSAYNAGPTRAARWRGLPEAEDPLRFVERIPFEETRGYVKAVVRNRALYEWLYGSGG